MCFCFNQFNALPAKRWTGLTLARRGGGLPRPKGLKLPIEPFQLELLFHLPTGAPQPPTPQPAQRGGQLAPAVQFAQLHRSGPWEWQQVLISD